MAPTSKPKSESKAKFTSATKIKKELLKSRNPGQYFLSSDATTTYSIQKIAVSFKKNDMKSKQQLLKGRKPGQRFVFSRRSLITSEKHSHIFQLKGKPQEI